MGNEQSEPLLSGDLRDSISQYLQRAKENKYRDNATIQNGINLILQALLEM